MKSEASESAVTLLTSQRGPEPDGDSVSGARGLVHPVSSMKQYLGCPTLGYLNGGRGCSDSRFIRREEVEMQSDRKNSRRVPVPSLQENERVGQPQVRPG